MSIADRLRDRLRKHDSSAIVVQQPASKAVDDMLREDKERARRTTAQRILDAPADFNRAARRSIGLTGRLWRWDVNGTEMQRQYSPRYARRHGTRVLELVQHTRPTSRRVRKERARVARIITSKGLA